MRGDRALHPILVFVLMLPFGVGVGAGSALLGFLVKRAGFPVSVAGSMVAIALLPSVGRVLLAPVVDLTLDLRAWYRIGVALLAGAMLALGLIPIGVATLPLVTGAALLGVVGANLVAVPCTALMAHEFDERSKGRAAGAYQAGHMVGAALGGGGGVWLAAHASTLAACVALAAIGPLCALALRFVPPVAASDLPGALGARLRQLAGDLRALARSREALLVALLVASPIGVGAASELWSAVAPDWHASANVVALANGVLKAAGAVVGCLAGGWVADRIGRWTSYWVSGVLVVLVALAMAAAARTPALFGSGVLLYSLALGMGNAAFSALLLYVIGRGAAATKYALLSSLGNVPVSYMTAFDGWAHDRWGAGGMLRAESALTLVCIAAGCAALWWLRPSVARAPYSPQPAD